MGILWIVGMDVVAYEVPAWGVGELYLRAGKLLYHELPRAGSSPADAAAHPLVDRLLAYFRGELVSFDDVEVDAEWGTPFREALADALRGIPWGEVVTYGELAALAGRPRAPRAAGTFCAENTFPLVVPCHRVVSSSGLGSYGSLGVEYKRRLLALEGVEL
jgi:methylated-DNA-[protein]-cysteine S-methyltransferase